MTDSTRIYVLEAITAGTLLEADYNRQQLSLAPHALFARRGELYLGAVNQAKAIRSDEEPRLGVFKLAGLSAVRVTDQPFDVLPESAQGLPLPEDELLFKVADRAQP